VLFDEILAFDKKMRLRHYKNLFGKVKERPGSLSATEAYSADVIYLMEKPTIKQFAECLGISQPNATYKVGNLIEKGYIKKETGIDDRREFRLHMADKFFGYFDANDGFLHSVIDKLKRKFSDKELETFEEVLSELNSELEN